MSRGIVTVVRKDYFTCVVGSLREGRGGRVVE